MNAVFGFIRRMSDIFTVSLLGVLFLTFLLQVFFRYVLNNPIGWTLEVCLTAWIWLVFWGAGFCLDDGDHVTFDMLYNSVSDRWRRIFTATSCLLICAAFAISLPATYDYIYFYRLKKSATLGIKLHYIFSIYGIFCLAIIAGYFHRFIKVAFMGAPVQNRDLQ